MIRLTLIQLANLHHAEMELFPQTARHVHAMLAMVEVEVSTLKRAVSPLVNTLNAPVVPGQLMAHFARAGVDFRVAAYGALPTMVHGTMGVVHRAQTVH